MLNIYHIYIYVISICMIYVSPLIHIPLDPLKDWVDRRRPLPLPFADPWSRVLADPPWSRWRKLGGIIPFYGLNSG